MADSVEKLEMRVRSLEDWKSGHNVLCEERYKASEATQKDMIRKINEIHQTSQRWMAWEAKYAGVVEHKAHLWTYVAAFIGWGIAVAAILLT